MAKYKITSGGGWAAIRYSWQMARKAGGVRKLFRALSSPNTCKTCALGMSGMRNEIGQSFQVCKKSMQAQAQDMQPGISAEFFENHSIHDLIRLTGRELEALGRLIHPIYLPEGATHFQVLSWDHAHQILLQNWRAAKPERSFFYTSGRSSMEAGYLIQLLARQWGTNNINNCSYYCHQASGVGLSQSLGSGTSTVALEDFRKADLVVLLGANPASNHPRMMAFLVELRRRGGQVVVINPFKEIGLVRFKLPSEMRSLLFGSEIASLYLQPHCGGDLALLKAAAVRLWREQKIDLDFLKNHCIGLEELQNDLESEDLELLLAKSGISPAEFQTFCRHLSESKNTIYAWAMGITHHQHGVENVRAIANLALLRGMVGKPGAGLLPIRGHSNVQGMGTVGVVPKLKPEMVEALLKHLNIAVPSMPGLDTFAALQAAHRGDIDFAVLVGGNLYAANPDSRWAGEALGRIHFTAFLSTTLNRGHIHGHGRHTLILPVRARDEETQCTSQESMFNYVRLSHGGQPAPKNELPSESEIFARMGEILFADGPIAWSSLRDHQHIREFIAQTVPHLHLMRQLDNGKEFTIPGRIKHVAQFNTANGRANLAVVPAPDARPKSGHFNLMTLRSEGQFNTIVYEDEDLYRGTEHRLVVFMNAEDIAANGFAESEWVWLESEIGKIKVQLMAGPIRAGNVAMYYPEANAIVPAKIDPQSKTPSFKRTAVKVYRVAERRDHAKRKTPQ